MKEKTTRGLLSLPRSLFLVSFTSKRLRWSFRSPVWTVNMPLVYCGLFDQYSRLQTPVARVIFNGAIRLLFPRRVSSRRRRTTFVSASHFLTKVAAASHWDFSVRWSAFPVLLGLIDSLSLASIHFFLFRQEDRWCWVRSYTIRLLEAQIRWGTCSAV